MNKIIMLRNEETATVSGGVFCICITQLTVGIQDSTIIEENPNIINREDCIQKCCKYTSDNYYFSINGDATPTCAISNSKRCLYTANSVIGLSPKAYQEDIAISTTSCLLL